MITYAIPYAKEPGKAALRRLLRSRPAQLHHFVHVYVLLIAYQSPDVLPSSDSAPQGALPAASVLQGKARLSLFAERNRDTRGTANATESKVVGHAGVYGETTKQTGETR